MRKQYIFKHIVIAFMLTAIASFSAKAQYSFGVSLNYAIAADELRPAANNGYGITLEGRKIIDEYVKVGVNVGYVTFANKKTDSKVSPLIDGDNLNIIPVTLTSMVYFNDTKLNPYISLDLGWATANMKLESGAKNFMMLAPGIGLDYTIAEQLSAQFFVKDNIMIYNRYKEGSDLLNFITINLGGTYKF